jgi:hypothetical protein
VAVHLLLLSIRLAFGETFHLLGHDMVQNSAVEDVVLRCGVAFVLFEQLQQSEDLNRSVINLTVFMALFKSIIFPIENPSR